MPKLLTCKHCGDQCTKAGCVSCYFDWLGDIRTIAEEVVAAEKLALSANRRLGREGEIIRGVAIDKLERKLREKP